jgi:hypothetical protein
MTFFVGHAGAIKLQRGGENTFTTTVSPSDVNTALNRFGFEGSDDNLITGDLLEISTEDPRGLLFMPATFWSIPGPSVDGYSEVIWSSGSTAALSGWLDDEISTSSDLPPEGYDDFRLSDYVISGNIRAYANINRAGGIRLFEDFGDAVNNERANEYALADFYGEPIEITVGVRDTRYNTLGSVTSFEINTDRAAMETTSLSDRFKQQYSAGLLSGNGSIECLFSYETVADQDVPLFLLQVINRLDVGSSFKTLLALSSVEQSPSFREEVYYDIEAVVTRAGVTVTSDALVACSVDFVTTGEFKIRVGVPPEYILKEDDDAIYLEQGLDYLLKEITD